MWLESESSSSAVALGPSWLILPVVQHHGVPLPCLWEKLGYALVIEINTYFILFLHLSTNICRKLAGLEYLLKSYGTSYSGCIPDGSRFRVWLSLRAHHLPALGPLAHCLCPLRCASGLKIDVPFGGDIGMLIMRHTSSLVRPSARLDQIQCAFCPGNCRLLEDLPQHHRHLGAARGLPPNVPVYNNAAAP
jgi:hypothetical protein